MRLRVVFLQELSHRAEGSQRRGIHWRKWELSKEEQTLVGYRDGRQKERKV